MATTTYIREVEDYSLLAKYYDELLGDEEAYSHWLKYLNISTNEEILELASGSGKLATILLKRGYKIQASDLSLSMRKIAISNGFLGDYLILDMRNFALKKKYDYILCFCDSFNYLKKEELLSFFKNISAHLKKGGTFLFDMHSVKRISEFADEYIEEGILSDGCQYQWTILSDKYASSLHENFIFYTNDGLICERHQQFVYSPNEIEKVISLTDLVVHWDINFIENEKVMGVVTKK